MGSEGGERSTDELSDSDRSADELNDELNDEPNDEPNDGDRSTDESADDDDDDRHESADDDDDDRHESAADDATKKSGGIVSRKDVERAQKRERKSGVVYMSRVPPFMRADKVRHMLEKYGEVGRVYLVEEDDKRRKRRVKGGGNRRRQYVEGWIEFGNKKYAKAVASMLNNTPMGGKKKHGFYHDDLWNLRYLPRFKWRHLVEQLATERAAKEQRLQMEVAQSRRELDAYIRSVDQAKKISGIRARLDAQIARGQDVQPMADRSRNVWQRDVVVRDPSAAAADSSARPGKRARRGPEKQQQQQPDAQITSVLGKIF
ncbi:hypothetical protein H4R18_001688 [Coemansia javaensis]|uniref:18S rRNA factor 2 n=1 Tax=Coemansia javaensis TaxID=2761396 RepID=A0A9W8HKR9_9FUNG|nr:hypothetical protein H4R18_001688 [Coemansia javaensis]